MSIVKVKEYLRKGRRVRAHTRNWNDAKYSHAKLQFNVDKKPEAKSEPAKPVVSKIVDKSEEEKANRAKALMEFKKREEEQAKKDNDPAELKKQAEYWKKIRDGRKKLKDLADQTEQNKKDAVTKKETAKAAKKESTKKPPKAKVGNKNIKALVKKVVETAAEKAKEFSGIKA